MAGFIYKVLPEGDWSAACRLGSYAGSPDDRRDGYIHFSTAEQLPGTLAKYFAGKKDLVLVTFDPAALATALRWEPARGGQLFPHHYGPIDPSLALSTRPLKVGDDGRHALPEELA